MWRLQLLGPVRLVRTDGALLPAGPKGDAVLACLGASRGTRMTRATLIDLLWNDRGAVAARNALRQWLFQMRRGLGDDDFLSADGDEIAIDASRCDVDLVRFMDLAASPDPAHWNDAAALYGGELAQGLAEPQAFGRWLAVQRAQSRTAAQSVLERMAARGDAQSADNALRLGAALLLNDPLHEGTYRSLMAVYARLGLRAKAMAVWHDCRRVLRTEMNAEPSEATRTAYEALLRDDAASASTMHVVRGHARPPPLAAGREQAQVIARDYMLQGQRYYFAGTPEDNARARESFLTAARIDPASIEATVQAAWTHFTDFQFGWNGEPDDNFRRCLRLADDLLRQERDHPFVQALWGRLLLWRGDYQGATDAFEYTVRCLPEHAAMLSNAADAAMRAGRLQRALDLVARAHDLEPGNPGIFLTVEGNTRYALGDLEGAQAAFESAWRRQPRLCMATSGLGAVYAELGRVDEAREMVRHAQEVKNLRLSLDFAQHAMPMADPGIRQRWLRAWEIAGAPRHEPRLAQTQA